MTQHSPDVQLEWEANVVEYVGFLWDQIKVHGNAGKDMAAVRYLPKDIPLMGPLFVPPSYFQLKRRQHVASLSPESAYIKAINVVHPFYYPTLTTCPKCKSKDILWNGWTGMGACKVHGIRKEERAIGYQLWCRACELLGDGAGYCYVTTNPTFWQDW